MKPNESKFVSRIEHLYQTDARATGIQTLHNVGYALWQHEDSFLEHEQIDTIRKQQFAHQNKRFCIDAGVIEGILRCSAPAPSFTEKVPLYNFCMKTIGLSAEAILPTESVLDSSSGHQSPSSRTGGLFTTRGIHDRNQYTITTG